ncbi:hypothetical protein ACWGLF_43480 [Streptomyces puniciscabiei]
MEDTLRPTRIVLGREPGEQDAEDIIRRIYPPLLAQGVPIIVSDVATAELAKTAANAFLATKISFINAMSEICRTAGADVHQLVASHVLDPSIGSRYVRPGLGFGGGCLPKDIRGRLK